MSEFEAEPPRVCNEISRKARRNQRCEECTSPILPGSSYREISGITDDGDFFRLRQHEECAAWYNAVSSFFDYFGAGLAIGSTVSGLYELDGQAPQ